MRAALLAATALWPLAVFGQQMDQSTAQMIMDTSSAQVPNHECFSGTCYPITFQQGDVVLSGSATDAQGNVWSLAPASCEGNGPANWWSALYENGVMKWCGYDVAIRIVNGTAWVEEAKFGGWSIPGTGQYVGNPGQGSGEGQTTDTSTTAAADTTTVDPAPPQNGQTCPGMTLPGAVTPNNGTFTANGNTYSINATDGDVASINGAPINAGAYETSQLVHGSNGQVYGQSNAAANNGQWFTLQGSGSDTWWQPSSSPPASMVPQNSLVVAQSSTDTTAQDRVALTVCPQIATIQAQISAANQQMQQLMAQQAQLTVQQQATSPPTSPADSTLDSSGTQ